MLFLKIYQDHGVELVIAKVVEDILVAGKGMAMDKFYNAISTKFRIGRFSIDANIIFSSLMISQRQSVSVYMNMAE